MITEKAVNESEALATLIPKFSKEELAKIKSYHTYSRKYQESLEHFFYTEFTGHPIWGKLILSIPEESRKANNELSAKFQYNAIFKGDWIPYIKYQMQQGVGYAQMGISFRDWYELINIVRNFLIPKFTKELEHNALELTNCLTGMNMFFDFAMSIIGEAYLKEKSRTIEQQMITQSKLNKELESFAYIISHDLKTPLRGISSLSEWIITDYADKLDDTGKEYLELLQSRTQRMEDLIDGVLRYSRIGRANMETSVVDLNLLIHEIVNDFSQEKNVNLTIGNFIPKIETSMAMMQQLFGNLISNSVKHCDKETTQIEVGCSVENNVFSCFVQDNGPGIPKDFHHKVFEIFQTLESKDDGASTGIGLTIVKKIVDTFGGDIVIINPKTGGTRFEFTLPNVKLL